MSNDRGLIRLEELQAFRTYCNLVSVGHAPGKGEYQSLVVYYGGLTHVISRNKANVLSTPVELRPLIENFRAQHKIITDTQRLDFMLGKYRKVVVERIGMGYFSLCVEEGFMGDKKYPSIEFNEASSIEEILAQKRQAIDLAIANQ